MDKKYLGLGVIFNSIDNGLSKSLEEIAKGLDKTTEKLDEAADAADGKGKGRKGKKGGGEGGIFSGLVEGFKTLSLGKIGSVLDDIKEGLQGSGTSMFSDLFLSLDTMQAKLSQTLDPKTIDRFNKSLLTTMRTQGLTADETEKLAFGMTNFGRSTDETIQSLPLMGTLVGKLGVSADEVSKLFGQGLASLRASPAQMEGLVKETVKMQKAYHLTDMVQDLPEIFAAVTANAAKFGKVNADATIKTVRSVSSLSAMFRTLGKSQSEALNISTGFVNKLSDMKRSITDMRAGLEPLDESIYDGVEALSLMGIQGDKAFDMLMKGADDPAKLMADLQKQMQGLDKETQDNVTARLRRIFGDDVTNAMASYGAEAQGAVAAAKKQAAVIGSSSKAFDDMTGAMDNTVAVQERLTKAAESFFHYTQEVANKKDYIQALQAQRKAWDDLTESTSQADSVLGWILRKFDLFSKFGLTGFFTEFAKIGILAGLAATLIFPITKLIGLFQIFGPILKGVFGIVGGLASTMLNFVTSTKAIGFAVKTATKVLGPLFSIATKLIRPFISLAGFGWKIVQVLGVITSAVLKLALSPIKMLIQGIFSLGAAFMSTPFGWITAAIVALGVTIYLLVKHWDAVKQAMSDFFDWGKSALAAFGAWALGAMDSVFDGIVKVWDVLKSGASMAWDFVKKIFSGEISFESIWTSLKDVLSRIPDYVIEMFDKAMAAVPQIFDKAMGAVAGFFHGGDSKPGGSWMDSVKGLVGMGGTAPSTPTSVQDMPAGSTAATMNQKGAPSKALSSSIPTFDKPVLDDQNFQGIVDAVVNMKETLATILQALADRPVNVTLQGDARKFFQASNKEAQSAAGQAGLANALSR